MAVIIAGERSGVGKTTVTLALLAALSHRYPRRVQSFKVGPDYIDPMFHQVITGLPCHNLDPVLTSESYVQAHYQRQLQAAQHVVIEGVMGLFDGATAFEDTASTAHIARLLQLPVLLVVDCSRLARSVAALVQGYQQFEPTLQLAGVVLNRVGSDRHLELLQTALATIGIPVVGVLRRDKGLQLPDRHLGLVPVEELANFHQVAQYLAAVGRDCFDWHQLEPLTTVEGQSFGSMIPVHQGIGSDKSRENKSAKVRIAIATDPAFNFYYPDNLTQLQQKGAELCPWSPLTETLPPDVSGLYFGGGFPEVFAEALAQNQAAKNDVKVAIAQGMPTYAECGGLMYLSETLVDFDGRRWSMVGSLAGSLTMTGQLSLGYRRAIALRDGPLLNKQSQICGHEFHRSQLERPFSPAAYRSERAFNPKESQLEGFCQGNVHASYIHIHWGARPDIALRFVTTCQQYQSQHQSA